MVGRDSPLGRGKPGRAKASPQRARQPGRTRDESPCSGPPGKGQGAGKACEPEGGNRVAAKRSNRAHTAPRLPAIGSGGGSSDERVFWELSSDLFAVLDAEGRFVKVNPAWERVLGWTAGQLIGRSARELIHPDDLAAVVAAGRRARRGAGRVARTESRSRCTDGTYRWLLWSTYNDGTYRVSVAKEISRRKAAEASREALRARSEEAYAATDVSTWEWDMERRCLAGSGSGANGSFEDATPPMSPAHRAAVESAAAHVADGQDTEFLLRYPATSSGGESRWLQSRGAAVLGRGGKVVGVRGTTQDVTEAVRAQIETRQSRDFAQTTLDSLAAYVVVLDDAGRILAVNAAWERMTSAIENRNVGVGADYVTVCDAIGVKDSFAATIAGSLGEMLKGRLDEFMVEYPCRTPDGERWLALRASRHIGAGPAKMVLQHHDITSRVRAEAELREARDYLAAVADSMGEALCTLDADGALVYMNPAAERLLGWKSGELRGRLMHDAVHFRRADGRPYPVADCPMTASRVSGAVVRVADDVFVRRDGTDIAVQYTSSPLKTGDAITGSVVVFSDITLQQAEQEKTRSQLGAVMRVRHIRDALQEERLVLYAQPIVDLASGAPVQHELLIRMLGRDGTLVLPDEFLPAAEQHGLITDIDHWVIRQAAHLCAGGHRVQLNLSGPSLADPRLLDFFRTAVEASGATPHDMVIELTETALMSNELLAGLLLEQASRMGFEIALDDFGTGYGGFAYLKRFPVDYLKIDIDFIRDIATNAASRHVVEAVVSLARSFGQKTVAEGIEDPGTIALITGMHVNYGQGFALGRPLPLEQAFSVRA